MKIKIGIKKRSLLINAPLIFLTAAIIASFFWQLRYNIDLRQELKTKRAEFKETKAAGQHLKRLEKQISDIEEKEEALSRKIPRGEKEPLGLMKTLIQLGGQIGFRKITFSLKEKTTQTQIVSSLSQGLDEDMQGLSGETQTPPSVPWADSTPSSFTPPQSGPVPINLEMNFEANFSQLLNFLEKLTDVERVVAIEGIRIERKKDILPYQKVTLNLITYTF